MNLFNNLGKSWSKSKTPEEQGQPCHQNNFVNYMQPQISALYQPQYQPQPHLHHQPPAQPFHQHHVYQQVHQPIQTIPLSTCPHQCQSHLIQSTHQSVAYQVQQHHNHLRNATLDPRPTEQQPMVLNNHIQAPMPQQQPAATGAAQQFVQAMPPFHHQTNNHVDSQVSLPTQQSQSRFSDNSYYSNHMAATLTYQQHDQQMHPPQQQKPQLDDRQRLQQQQQQQHQHHHQQQQVQQQILQHNQQQQDQHRHRQQLVKQQQQYQNHQAVNDLANGHSDGGLSLETLCLLHEKDNEVLNKMGICLKENLKNLGDELEKIRRETPKYSVDEVKI